MIMLFVSGISLFEALIALAMSGLLIMSLGEVYLHIKRNFFIAHRIMQTQQEGLYVTQLLNKYISLIGSNSCDGYKKATQPVFAYKTEDHNDALKIYSCWYYQGKYQAKSIEFYLAKTLRKQHNQPVYALYAEPQGGRRVELVPNISQLKFTFLLAGQSVLIPGYAIKDWSKVRAIAFKFVISHQSYHRSWYGFMSLHDNVG